MTRFIRLLAAGLAMAACAAIPARAQGTAEQRQACMSDALSLCAGDIPHVGRIAACLRREQARVSPACLRVMDVSTRAASLKP